MVTLEIREEVNKRGDNKENENTMNQLQKGKSGAQAKVVFGASGGKGHGGPRDSLKEKRAGITKGVDINSTRPKNPKVVKPMKGLVFGPSSEESERSMNGKRLRLEKDNVGRPGGYFAKGMVGQSEEVNLKQIQEETNTKINGDSMMASTSTDLAICRDLWRENWVIMKHNISPRFFYSFITCQ